MVCLDASFLVDFLRDREQAVSLMKSWRDSNERVSIAAPALVELASGAALADSGGEMEIVDKLARNLVLLPLDREGALLAGKIDAELAQAGETIGLVDVMIAAVAMEHGETLITRNLRHFNRISQLMSESY